MRGKNKHQRKHVKVERNLRDPDHLPYFTYETLEVRHVRDLTNMTKVLLLEQETESAITKMAREVITDFVYPQKNDN